MWSQARCQIHFLLQMNMSPGSAGRDPDGACSHCHAVINVLTTGPATVDHAPTAWRLAVLQRVVHLGSAEDSYLLTTLSSTALCNLLVLLEMNAATLCEESLAQFLRNVEGLPFVKKEEWCWFLVQRVRERAGIAHHQHFVPQEQDAEQVQRLLSWGEDSDMETTEEEGEERLAVGATAESDGSNHPSAPPSPGKAGAELHRV